MPPNVNVLFKCRSTKVRMLLHKAFQPVLALCPTIGLMSFWNRMIKFKKRPEFFSFLENLNCKLLVVLFQKNFCPSLYFLAPKLVHILLLYKRNAFNFANRNPPIVSWTINSFFSVSQDMRKLQVVFDKIDDFFFLPVNTFWI